MKISELGFAGIEGADGNIMQSGQRFIMILSNAMKRERH